MLLLFFLIFLFLALPATFLRPLPLAAPYSLFLPLSLFLEVHLVRSRITRARDSFDREFKNLGARVASTGMAA